jgi:hypothetical protein
MYLLLGPHPSGAVLQELTQAGHPHPANPEPRPVSANELADVVLRTGTKAARRATSPLDLAPHAGLVPLPTGARGGTGALL